MHTLPSPKCAACCVPADYCWSARVPTTICWTTALSPRRHKSTGTPTGRERAITFQLWHWHDDGEHYDLEHVQLRSAGGEWRVQVRRTTYWALGRGRLAALAAEAGFTDLEWRLPQETGFFQPLLTARAGT